jgi:L-ascorbate metabolism protein UlaG (beta-lactamase superfamily)
LLVESGDVRLVTDPWLDGPTYLGSWWQFPEPVLRGADLRATHVYLTHEHADHLHPPTLAAIPKHTPILIGRFMTPRFRSRLAALGFTDVREMPHGKAVTLGDLRLTSYQYRADDTALVIEGPGGTILDLNDCLLRAGALDHLLARHPRIDLLLASFANAEAYPIVYGFEDPTEQPDWDDRVRFDDFLDKVRTIDPVAFTPFASSFCFLSPEQRWLNTRIVSPEGLLARARAGEVKAEGLAMNPGDFWTPERGHDVRGEVDWSRKEETLERYAQAHAGEIAAVRAGEHVPGGRAALERVFRAYFAAFSARVPPPLRKVLDLSLRIEVTGPAGCTLWARWSRGRLDLSAPRSDDAWEVALEVPDFVFWVMVSRGDWWQHLGVSCRFRVKLRPGVRSREVWLWTLL